MASRAACLGSTAGPISLARRLGNASSVSGTMNRRRRTTLSVRLVTFFRPLCLANDY